MEIFTRYLADFELTTLIRPMLDRSHHKVFDPFWLGSGAEGGLGLFVSALDAEVYRQTLREIGEHWLRIPLSRFDLLGHARDMNGRLQCRLIFGFSATLAGELAVRHRVPRPYLVPFDFEVPRNPTPPVTFQFPSKAFAFMKGQWAVLGACGHEDEIERINQLSDSELSSAAADALGAIERGEALGDPAHEWCVFSPEAKRWRFGPDEHRQLENLH